MKGFSMAALRIVSAAVGVVLFLAAFAVSQAGEPTVPEHANPPLWVVEKDGKTLYLFGSIHLLPPQTKWQRPEIDEARAKAQVFVFEAPLDDGGAAMVRFIEKSGRLPEGQTLSDILPTDLHNDLEKAAWSVQYPPKMLEPFRPWLAAVYIELYAYIKVGFSSYYGVDHVIEQDARAHGAELAYFESVEEQLSYFAALDRKTEVAYLKATIRGALDEPDLAFDLLSAWASGSTDTLSKLLDDGFKDVPELRSGLLIARNRKWIPRVKDMLASNKTHFVTVGIGHLVGKDSVVAMLRAKGYKVSGP